LSHIIFGSSCGWSSEGIERADICLQVLSRFLALKAWLSGRYLSLADLQAAPMICYLRATREGAALMERYGAIDRWWR
jgi:glutathione S-transferase